MLILLAIIGAASGAAINWCIHRLGDQKLNLSPWSARLPNASPAQAMDWLPVLGWCALRRDSAVHGKRFWLRPLVIELIWLVGLPLLYLWYQSHGLTGGVVAPAGWTTVWLVGHAILFSFLFVATFIDFDQRIIPDNVTIPGAIIALVLAIVWPGFRLPEVTHTLVGPAVVSVDFADARPIPVWHRGGTGLGMGLAIFAIWILALLPKFNLRDISWKSLKIVFISAFRFLQKNNMKVRAKTRRIGWTYLGIGILGLATIAIVWQFSPMANRASLHDSLFGALIGLGFGGFMLWSVRIVASHSLGQEAMGFGDVTLMAMIGAFLGWQAALIVFALSPFAALAIVLVNFLITRERELAFGPYLCLSALITIFAWPTIWPMAKQRFFLFPELLIAVLGGSLVLLMFMMLGVRMLRRNDRQ